MDKDLAIQQPLIQAKPSLQSSKKKRASWLKRTFAPMKKGGIRGNIFLMMVTTTGCAFFYLPMQAKKTGLVLTIGLLFFVMSVSYYSSTLLYLGFKATKASTYDQCMDYILGVKLGFLSNFMIFVHTFAATVSVWLFSFDFLFYATQSVFLNNISNDKELDEIRIYSFYFFSIFIGTLLFISSIFQKIQFLKKLSMIGIFIIFYLLLVFLVLLPDYYMHYKNRIEIVWAKFDHNFFATNGICFYLFLNQYTVLPICNNLKKIRSQRIMKVIRRTDTISFLIYILFTLIGYFSIPNTVVGTAQEKQYELFLIRPPIDNKINYWVTVGQFLFGVNLIIAVLVKGHFLYIYFEQIIYNIKKAVQKLKQQKIQKDEEISEIKEQNSEVSQMSFSLPNVILQTKKKNQNIKCNKIVKFLFFSVTTILAICLEKVLHKFVSLVGSFVGVFEIVVFPLIMILIINSKQKILGTCHKHTLIIVSLIFATLGFTSFVNTLIYAQIILFYQNFQVLHLNIKIIIKMNQDDSSDLNFNNENKKNEQIQQDSLDQLDMFIKNNNQKIKKNLLMYQYTIQKKLLQQEQQQLIKNLSNLIVEGKCIQEELSEYKQQKQRLQQNILEATTQLIFNSVQQKKYLNKFI